MTEPYNTRYPEELQVEIMENMLKWRKTAQREDKLTNKEVRKYWPLVKEKWALWAVCFKMGLHYRDWEKINKIEQIVDEFYKVVRQVKVRIEQDENN